MQDDVGLDVNVLLLSLLASKLHRRALDTGEIAGADACISAWRTEVVTALRAIRRRMKSGPLPAPSESTNKLREDIKRAELQSERIQQAELAVYLDGLQALADGEVQPQADSSGAEAAGSFLGLTAHRVLGFYADSGQGLRALTQDELEAYALHVAHAAHQTGVGPA